MSIFKKHFKSQILNDTRKVVVVGPGTILKAEPSSSSMTLFSNFQSQTGLRSQREVQNEGYIWHNVLTRQVDPNYRRSSNSNVAESLPYVDMNGWVRGDKVQELSDQEVRNIERSLAGLPNVNLTESNTQGSTITVSASNEKPDSKSKNNGVLKYGLLFLGGVLFVGSIIFFIKAKS